MHSQQPPGVVQNWSTLQCSKQNTEQCGYDHAPVTRGRMRAQFPLPHGPTRTPPPRPAPRSGSGAPPGRARRIHPPRLRGGGLVAVLCHFYLWHNKSTPRPPPPPAQEQLTGVWLGLGTPIFGLEIAKKKVLGRSEMVGGILWLESYESLC